MNTDELILTIAYLANANRHLAEEIARLQRLVVLLQTEPTPPLVTDRDG